MKHTLNRPTSNGWIMSRSDDVILSNSTFREPRRDLSQCGGVPRRQRLLELPACLRHDGPPHALGPTPVFWSSHSLVPTLLVLQHAEETAGPDTKWSRIHDQEMRPTFRLFVFSRSEEHTSELQSR